jgi:hypothetical protein
MQTWAFGAAARRGIEIDRDKLDGWREWSLESSLKKRDKTDELVGARNLDGLSQLLLGREKQPNGDEQKSYAQCVDLIIAGQNADGSWKAHGQLPGQKRPGAETMQVSTMWNALALGSWEKLPEKAQQARGRALAWLKSAKPGKSTEWFAARLLLFHQTGKTAEQEQAVAKLRGLQNKDGGWSWLIGDESDAFATGMSLYALRTAGVAADDAAVGRGVRFLLDTQRGDGSWAVKGTKEKKKGSVQETAVYWGTAWAVIGLAQTLE